MKNEKNDMSEKHLINAKIQSKKKIRVKTEVSVAGFIKTILILFFIAVQIALLVLLHFKYVLTSRAILITTATISFLTCIYVLSSNRNSHSKAVWIIFLLTFYSFAYLIFWMSDERIFFNRTKKRYKAVYKSTQEKLEQKVIYNTTKIKQTADFLYSTGNFLSYNNTNMQYFSCGSLLFADLIDSIKKAKKFVFMEFFIVSDGVLFDEIFDILIKKASQGVIVRLIYDDLGSKRRLLNKTKIKLKKSGIKIMPFSKMLPILSVALNYRDHRKIIVVDGKVAYTGGCNLADEYINAKQIHGYWKDTGVRIEGEAVDGLTLIFLRQWEVLNKTREDYSQFMKLSPPQNNANTVIPYADGLDYAHPIARGAYENLIAGAEKFLFIMSPYFIVDDGITNLLINKALSGVEVKIFLPEIPDKKIVYTISRSNAEKLIDYGVKVYVVKNTFVHSKLMLTENCVAIGSVNMDLRSFYQQFECGVITDDQKVTKSVYLDFLQTQQNSLEINQKNKRSRNIFYRIFVGLMQVFAPLM